MIAPLSFPVRQSSPPMTSGMIARTRARVENGDGPTLLLNGHVDTVLEARGWSGDPWGAGATVTASTGSARPT